MDLPCAFSASAGRAPAHPRRFGSTSVPGPTAPCAGTTVRGLNAGRVERRQPGLHARRRSGREKRLVHHHVAGKQHPVALDEEPRVAAGVGRPDDQGAHAQAAESSVYSRSNVMWAGRRAASFRSSAVSGERPENVFTICMPVSSNSFSCVVELTSFEAGGNAR